ncbi:hypothetical protein Hanom_Chr12g01108361 [Helianthus anomalus]
MCTETFEGAGELLKANVEAEKPSCWKCANRLKFMKEKMVELDAIGKDIDSQQQNLEARL